MSETATVVIAEDLGRKSEKAPFQAKDGNGKYWKRWDENFAQYVGKQVELEYYDKSREYNGKNYTDSIVTAIRVPEAPAHEPTQGENGDVDWDLIGLRKTRCHLWGAFLQGDACQSLIALKMRGEEQTKPSELASFLVAVGRRLVLSAEVDIYHRRPAAPEEDIPF